MMNSSDYYVLEEPNIPIGIRVVNCEKIKETGCTLSSYIFTISVNSRVREWKIKRRYSDILNLEKNSRASLEILHPAEDNIDNTKCSVPRIPGRRDYFMGEKRIEEWRQQLERYLQDIIDMEDLRQLSETLKFLGVSRFSFMDTPEPKSEEYFLRKISSETFGLGLLPVQIRQSTTWTGKFLLIKDTWIGVMDSPNGRLENVILMNRHFRLSQTQNGFFFSNSSTKLSLRKRYGCKADEWLKSVTNVKNLPAWDFISLNRFKSFAPLRLNSHAKWFVDGDLYMMAVADAMESAQKVIFIADWWLSPELYLKRPKNNENDDWRLDRILERKAKKGVKIFILIFKDRLNLLKLQSSYTEKTLACHQNIKILSYPDYLLRNQDNLRHHVSFSHHEKLVIIDQSWVFTGGIDLCYGRWDDNKHRLVDTKKEPDRYWIGKDYINLNLAAFSKLEKPYEDLIDRKKIPRTPWHDVCAAVGGRVARDAARHFIERWNFVKASKVNRDNSYPFLIPRSYNECSENIPSWMTNYFHVNCQVIRSVGQWSAGVQTEDSIHLAYCSAIRESKHYIYIENQFFISLAAEDNSVHNKISQTLLKRILKARSEQRRFRVYVVMPLLPGFEGEIKPKKGTSLLAICHWIYSSICRGPKSLMEKLKEKGIDPSEYITFYGLRKHSKLSGELVTEQIYVHSKLMIVDDKTVICGSANINDRSLLGNRDSEICFIFKDLEFTPSEMDGRPYNCGRFAGSLRKHLFQEHLGFLEETEPIDSADLVSESFYREFCRNTASSNTEIYEKVFNCLPASQLTTFSEVESYRSVEPLSIQNPEQAEEELKQLKGNLVLLPLDFLCNENLQPPLFTREFILPTAVWT